MLRKLLLNQDWLELYQQKVTL